MFGSIKRVLVVALVSLVVVVAAQQVVSGAVPLIITGASVATRAVAGGASRVIGRFIAKPSASRVTAANTNYPMSFRMAQYQA